MKFSCCFCVSLALNVLSSICLNCFKPENKACQGIQFLAMSLLFYACPNQHYYFYHNDSDVGRQDTMWSYNLVVMSISYWGFSVNLIYGIYSNF